MAQQEGETHWLLTELTAGCCGFCDTPRNKRQEAVAPLELLVCPELVLFYEALSLRFPIYKNLKNADSKPQG